MKPRQPFDIYAKTVPIPADLFCKMGSARHPPLWEFFFILFNIYSF